MVGFFGISAPPALETSDVAIKLLALPARQGKRIPWPIIPDPCLITRL